MLQSAPFGAAIIGPDLRYVMVNEVMRSYQGTARESPIGRTLAEVLGDRYPAAEARIRGALAGKALSNAATILHTPGDDGEERVVLATYFPLRVDGTVVACGVITTDVTDQERIRRELGNRTDLYNMLARVTRAAATAGSEIAVFREVCEVAVSTGRFRFAWVGVPEQGRITPVASAGEDHGYLDQIFVSTDENDPRAHGPAGRAFRLGEHTVFNDFLGEAITALWHRAAEQAGFAAAAAFPLLRRGKPAAVLTLYAASTGYFTPPRVETLRELSPAIGLALDRFEDERERQRSEEKLRRSQTMQAVGQIAAGVAHDFNNLLTVINGFSEMLLSQAQPGGPDHELVEEILDAGKRAAALTRQLLSFSRQQLVEPRIIDLNAVVRDAERILRRVIREDVRLSLQLMPGAAPIVADPHQVSQVLINLAINARDAMPQGGTLLIETHDAVHDEHGLPHAPPAVAGAHVVLRVRDTGVGMDRAVLARVFEPFFTTKSAGKGTGLGLATVWGIVEQAKGTIAVRSTVGAGTTFDVYWPVASGRATELAAGETIELPAGTETVLIVEDDDAVRAVARRILAPRGYTILEAPDGAAGIALAKSCPSAIHLLLSDVVLPGANGRAVAEQITSHHPSCRVLLMSGYTDDELVQRGVGAGELAFLHKPFTAPVLARKVREVLDGPAPQR